MKRLATLTVLTILTASAFIGCNVHHYHHPEGSAIRHVSSIDGDSIQYGVSVITVDHQEYIIVRTSSGTAICKHKHEIEEKENLIPLDE